MKRLFLAIGLFATMACAGLHAQTMDMHVNVPFNFQMGEKIMPAGRYVIHHADSVLTMRQQGGSNATIVRLTQPTIRRDTPKAGSVVFNRYGGSYFLSQIWTSNSRDGRTVLKSTREKELARNSGPVYSAGIPAR